VPLFTATDVPPEHVDPKMVDAANLFYDRLVARKVDSFEIAEPRTGYRYSNLARAYMQSHVRRCLSFIDSGYAELQAGRLLPVYAASRSVLETVAVMCDFVATIAPPINNANYMAAEELIASRALATRIPSFAQKGEPLFAVQILNQIDKMDKRYPGYRDQYDHLSDIAHPNALGAVVHFCNFDRDVAVFADGINDESKAAVSLVLGAFKLGYAVVACEDLEPLLLKLSERAPLSA